MTTYDPVTSGVDVLTAAAVATLASAGYTWSPLTTSFSSYLATALTGIGGTSVSDKTMSVPQLLAGLVNGLNAGPVTHLNTGVDKLLALLANATAAGIVLSNATFTAGSAQGTAIGALSVVGGTGTYTFTLTDSHSNAVQVAGTNGVNLQAGSASASAGSFSITVHADNGAGSTFDKTFLITATPSGGGVALKADFSDANANEAWVFW